MVRMMADLIRIHGDFLKKHQEIINIAKVPGPKGDKPTRNDLIPIIRPLIPDPIHGKSPTKDELISLIFPLIPKVKDGKTPTEGELISLISSLIPEIKEKTLVFTEEHISKVADKVSKRIKFPSQSKVPIDELDIENLLSLLDKRPKGKRLNIDFIDGLSQTIQSLSSQITSKGYLHGGGDVVKAGNNITITIDSNGNKVISSTGGSSGGGTLQRQLVSGTIDGVNKIFTVPLSFVGSSFIDLNGNTQADSGIDYTYDGNVTITYNVAPPNTGGNDTHYLYSGGGTSSTTWYQDEIVASGTTGTSFSLLHAPSAVVFLYKNGQYLVSGIGQDYTRSGVNLTLAVSLLSTDILTANYL